LTFGKPERKKQSSYRFYIPCGFRTSVFAVSPFQSGSGQYKQLNVTKTNGSTIILEAVPDKDGDYWWWTTNGTVQFFQNVYVVR
jgi:hypothetical protein